jgi:hypothetical protein
VEPEHIKRSKLLAVEVSESAKRRSTVIGGIPKGLAWH